jgi:hypothetical protein
MNDWGKLIENDSLRTLATNFDDVNLPLLRTLERVNRTFTRYRTNSIKGREARLTNELRSGKLVDEYDALRSRYAEARRLFKKFRKQYERTHRNMNGWEHDREAFLSAAFPDLTRTLLIDRDSPADLAVGHLALKYDLRRSYMKAVIFKARKKRKSGVAA